MLQGINLFLENVVPFREALYSVGARETISGLQRVKANKLIYVHLYLGLGD